MDIVFVAIILKNGICLEHYMDVKDAHKTRITGTGKVCIDYTSYSVAKFNGTDDVLQVVGEYDVRVVCAEIASISIKTYTQALTIHQTNIGQLICTADNIRKCEKHNGIELT